MKTNDLMNSMKLYKNHCEGGYVHIETKKLKTQTSPKPVAWISLIHVSALYSSTHFTPHLPFCFSWLDPTAASWKKAHAMTKLFPVQHATAFSAITHIHTEQWLYLGTVDVQAGRRERAHGEQGQAWHAQKDCTVMWQLQSLMQWSNAKPHTRYGHEVKDFNENGQQILLKYCRSRHCLRLMLHICWKVIYNMYVLYWFAPMGAFKIIRAAWLPCMPSISRSQSLPSLKCTTPRIIYALFFRIRIVMMTKL